MVFFLIKKSFFNAWDNIFKLVIINIVFILLLLISAFPTLFYKGSDMLIVMLLAVPSFFLLHLYTGAVSPLICAISDFKTMEFKLFRNSFFKTWKMSLVVAAINTALFFAAGIGVPFYLTVGGFIGKVAIVLLIWLVFFGLLCSQFYFVVRCRFNGTVPEIIKKTLLITAENPFLAFFILLFSLFLFAFSIFTLFIIPGITAVLLLEQNYIKLRINKFQWMERNPEHGRRKMPWKEIIKEDNENLGRRTVKGFVFPWKD